MAATAGVMSSAALIDLYSALDEAAGSDDDANAPDAATSAVANDLRTAYSDGNADTRRAALLRLWGVTDAGGAVPYARMVLTAHAAARVSPRRTG